jgi:hypothetical protein
MERAIRARVGDRVSRRPLLHSLAAIEQPCAINLLLQGRRRTTLYRGPGLERRPTFGSSRVRSHRCELEMQRLVVPAGCGGRSPSWWWGGSVAGLRPRKRPWRGPRRSPCRSLLRGLLRRSLWHGWHRWHHHRAAVVVLHHRGPPREEREAPQVAQQQQPAPASHPACGCETPAACGTSSYEDQQA